MRIFKDFAKELRELTLLLVRTDKESFIGALDQWHVKCKSFLDERTISIETSRSF
jgi:hypothetical protein